MEEEILPKHIGSFEENGIVLRKCRCCRKIKELNEINFLKRNTENGWRGRCRVCHNKNIRINQEMNPTELERSRRWREKASKEFPLKFLLKSCKSNSKRYNNREFTITLDDLDNQWNKQKGICYYTNKPMLYQLGNIDSVSIDRKDSSIGYTKENIVLCKKKVNIMKNDATIKDLLQFCTDILNNKDNIK